MLSQFSNILPIPTAIAIIKEIEEVYPTWTTFQLIDNLSFVGALDSTVCESLFGVGNGDSFLPKGKLTQIDFDSLTSTIDHQIYNDNGFYQEVGISLDSSTGRVVALGHTIAGISAGIDNLDRRESSSVNSYLIDILRGVKFSLPILNIDGIMAPSIDSPTTFEILPQTVAMDPLYSMTIAGDIARTITGDQELWTEESYPVEIGGIGTEASSAEIYGNIDGFWIGTWLRTDKGKNIFMRMSLPMDNPNNIKLSTVLGEYYGTIKVENRVLNMTTELGTKIISSLRFSNFLGILKSTDFRLNMLLQSITYQLLYSNFNEIGVCDPESIIKAHTIFEEWCVSEFNKFKKASILSKETGIRFVDCIDDRYSDRSYLSLNNYFISQSDNSDPDVQDFVAWYPKHRKTRY